MNDTRPGTATSAMPCGALDSVALSLVKTAHLLEAHMEDALATVGLSGAKHGLLTLLAAADEPLTLSDLATGQSCVRSNITQLVDRLEADGLVRRVDDPDDRRVVRAELTPRGRERQVAGAAKAERAQADFLRPLEDADRAALVRLLSALG